MKKKGITIDELVKELNGRIENLESRVEYLENMLNLPTKN